MLYLVRLCGDGDAWETAQGQFQARRYIDEVLKSFYIKENSIYGVAVMRSSPPIPALSLSLSLLLI